MITNPYYVLIRDYYGSSKAERSRVPLINHINEGLSIMLRDGASADAMGAYCIHPMLQSDDAIQVVPQSKWIQEVSPNVLLLAMEYRKVANSYLCTPKTDGWSVDQARDHIGMILPEVHAMLRADKLQNQKDFMIHHMGTHPRSDRLTVYFENWLDILGVHSEDRWAETQRIPHAQILGHTRWSVGKGWHQLLDKLFTDIEQSGVPVAVTTVKEKFGQLRIYFRVYGSTPASTKIHSLVNAAVDLASTTCDVCGGHAHVDTYYDTNLVRTRCPIHRDSTE